MTISTQGQEASSCALPPLRLGPGLTDTSGMALLERELPLTALADYANEARRGDGRVVLVSGEAGVGKSALLEEFAAGLSDAPGAGARATGCSRRAR